MNVVIYFIDFLFPIFIPFLIAAFAAYMQVLAARSRIIDSLQQVQPGFISSSPLFRYQNPFWHELSLAIAFAYISFDIWALLLVFQNGNEYFVSGIKNMNLQLIIMVILYHFVYSAWRAFVTEYRLGILIAFNSIAIAFVIIIRILLKVR